MDSAVKLTVKTPNQQFKDIEVNCDESWSVKKLKEFLTDVYPTKPDSSQVRLIYSGHLLNDEVQLKEIFIQDDMSNIVHIVCPHLAENTASINKDEMKQSSTHPEEFPLPPQCQPPNTGHIHASHLSQSYYQQFARNIQNVGSDRSISTPDYNPLWSYAWMQYLAKMQEYYMMLYQRNQQQQQPVWLNAFTLHQWQMNFMSSASFNTNTGGYQYWQPYGSEQPFSTVSPTRAAESVSQSQAYDEAVAAGNAAENVAQNEAVNGPEEQVNPAPPLNAGGAMFNDEEDNEDGRRDWLDWIHTFLRASVMLSIMYFYSSTIRILMIGLLGFIIYLYQAGWFLPRRVPRADTVNNQNQNNDREWPGENGDLQNENNDHPESPEENEQSQQRINEREYGFFNTFCTFVTSFFTSLLPQGT